MDTKTGNCMNTTIGSFTDNNKAVVHKDRILVLIQEVTLELIYVWSRRILNHWIFLPVEQ